MTGDRRFPAARRGPQGLRVLCLEKFDAPLVTVLVRGCNGSLSDPPGKEGLTELCVRLLTRGTEREDAATIDRRVDRLGGSMSLEADHECLDLSLDLRPEDATTGLELLGELIREAIFPRSQIDLVISQMTSEIRALLEDPSVVARKHFRRRLYGDETYGRPVLGTEASLSRIGRDDLIDHASRLLAPTDLILVTAGPVMPEAFHARVDELLHGLGRAGAAGLTAPAASFQAGPGVHLVHRPELTQVDVLVGYAGPGRTHADRIPLRLAAQLLGGGGTSRLFRELRARQGLSYDLGADVSTHLKVGEVLIGGATRPGSAVALVEGILQAVDEMRSGLPAPEELACARRVYDTELAGLTETADLVALLAADVEQFRLESDLIARARQLVHATDPDRIRQVVRTYLTPGRRHIVLVGPVLELADRIAKRWGEPGRMTES